MDLTWPRYKDENMRISIILIACLSMFACKAQKEAATETAASSVESLSLGSEEDQVKQCFDGYKSSILNDNGEEAVKYVDQRTITYYTEILKRTLDSDSTEVEELNIMDKLMVFSMRHRTSKEELLGFDGKTLLVYAIKEGMVGKNSVSNIELGEVTIDKAFAQGQVVSNGMAAPVYFHFYKEANEWKIDLTSIFPMGIMAFKGMADESGMEENEYLFMLLELITGEAPSDKVWDTIK